tara:strand:+ start:4246 stop:6438 length:2193 start_codon:yes stop_codon:yes gene_type:complete
LKKKSLFFFILLSSGLLYSQELLVKYTKQKIIIDGAPDDNAWKTSETASEFWQYRPTDSVKALKQTEFKALFDNENLYFLLKAYTKEKKFTVYNLERDFETKSADYVQLIFDTFNDASNAFKFQTNHLGLKGDMLLSTTSTLGGRGMNPNWDAIWEVESKLFDDSYIAEIKIPFNQLYFLKGAKSWRFNIYRSDTQSLEHSTWSKTPQEQRIGDLAFMGKINFERPLGESQKPFSFIPYLNGSVGKDFVENNNINNFDYGIDLKIPIGNSLNVDLTVNPDFSQVEVDDQLVNITRYELRLPEKRQFFTQNSDLFTDFGQQRDAEPFFSRRIGISRDLLGNTIENKIISGLKISGKINDNLRIGLLSVLTEENINKGIAQNSSSVFTLRKKVFTRSNYSFFFINRQNTKNYNFKKNERFNRVIGFEYNLASKDGKWKGKSFFHKSFRPKENNNSNSFGLTLSKNSRKHYLSFGSSYVGDDFRSDLGYYRRYGFIKLTPFYQYRIYPKSNKKILNYEFQNYTALVYRPNKNQTFEGRWFISSFKVIYRDVSEIEIKQNIRKDYLYDDFDPTRTEGSIPLSADRFYSYTDYEISYSSPDRNLFKFKSGIQIGDFFSGSKFSINNEFKYRIQPYFNASVKINFDSIKLPKPHTSKDIWLISPRFQFTPNKKISWTTYVQYSNQYENLGINSRFKWRFAPLSDLYLVYNDNYFYTNSFEPQFRSINLKLTYWINI